MSLCHFRNDEGGEAWANGMSGDVQACHRDSRIRRFPGIVIHHVNAERRCKARRPCLKLLDGAACMLLPLASDNLWHQRRRQHSN